VGRDVCSGDELQQLLAVYKGNSFAKAVLDTAWWGLSQKITGQPLHQTWGATRDEVPVGADFGIMDSIDELLDSIDGAVAAGFARIKLKFRPGWDIEMVRAVRRRFPTQTIHIDCNSGYTLDDLPMFQALDELNLAMIEQPLAHDDLIDHATLQRQIKTPVCLDESITSPRRAAQAIACASGKLLNVKPGRVGGLTNALKIHDLAQTAGVPCWVGGMLESSTGASHCAALAMLENFTYPADIFPSSRFYREDLSDPPLELVFADGKPPSIVAPRDIPEPVPERLKKLTVQQANIPG
jgi:O-succinylbenzoate synthase